MRVALLACAALLVMPIAAADHHGRIDGLVALGPCVASLAMAPMDFEDWWRAELTTNVACGPAGSVWPVQEIECLVRGSPSEGFEPARACRGGRELAIIGAFAEDAWSPFEADWSGLRGPGLGCYRPAGALSAVPPECDVAAP